MLITIWTIEPTPRVVARNTPIATALAAVQLDQLAHPGLRYLGSTNGRVR